MISSPVLDYHAGFENNQANLMLQQILSVVRNGMCANDRFQDSSFSKHLKFQMFKRSPSR